MGGCLLSLRYRKKVRVADRMGWGALSCAPNVTTAMFPSLRECVCPMMSIVQLSVFSISLMSLSSNLFKVLSDKLLHILKLDAIFFLLMT